jgi:Zn-dependent protease
MGDLYGFGIYVGEIARIRIRIHWILLVMWFLDLQNAMQGGEGARSARISGWVLGVLISFGSILLHEFGHCLAARKVGGFADEVLLWPFGGLAFCACPDFWKAHLIVAVGGPLVTVAICGVSYGTFALLHEYAAGPWMHTRLHDLAYFYLVYWNFFILIFNMVPIYPMDGGRILHSLLWGWFSRRSGYLWGGKSLASRLTLNISRVAAAGGIIYGISTRNLPMTFIFVWAWMQSEQLNRNVVL